MLNDSLYQEIHKAVNGFSIYGKESKIGYLNVQGNQVIDNKFNLFRDYDLLGNFLKGRAVVKIDNQFGVIDTIGEFLLKPKYDFINNLVDYFGVQDEGAWALMDSSYKIISEFEFESIELLSDRFILFKKNGKFGLMDLKLNVILHALYTSVMNLNGFLIVSNQSGNALFDEKGNQILSFKKWSIYNVDPNHLVIIDMESFEIVKYIDKRTGIVVNKP
jgi:hypothetical protein